MRSRWLAVVLGVAVACAREGVAQTTAAPAPAPATTNPAPAPPAPIPVPDIAAEAESTVTRLRAFEAGARPPAALLAIEAQIPQLEQRIARGTQQTDVVLREHPAFSVIEGLLFPWEDVAAQARGWVGALTEHARALDASLGRIDAMRAQWIRTRDAAPGAEAPAATLERIEDTIALIESVRRGVAERRAAVLMLQDRAARQVSRAQEVIDQLQAARQGLLGRIAERDGPAIWELVSRHSAWSRAQRQASETLAAEVPFVQLFAVQHASHVVAGIVAFLALGWVFTRMRARARRWTSMDDSLARRFRPLERPWASATLLTLLTFAVSGPLEPQGLQTLAALLAFFPITRLIAELMPPPLRPAVWAVGIFRVLDLLRSLMVGAPLLEQTVFQAEMIALVLVAAWLWRGLVARAPTPARRQAWASAGGAVVAVAAFACVAALLGYSNLARATEFGVIGIVQWALLLSVLVRLGDALVGWMLRVRPLRLLRAVQERRAPIERRLERLLRIAAVVLWATSIASLMAIAGPARDVLVGIFGRQVGWGAVSVSLGDVVAFAVVLWLTQLVASATATVLRDDVLTRVELARGAPMALSSLVQYALLLIGFLLALGVLGVDLTRITIVAGALGVGVGFGLQNVVNNCVSGLILLFERPIQVGDSVQLGQLTGEVKRIGMRSSTVRTFEGAEVIVPNADLVSDQVTNWTLSDRMRRIDIDVGVAYGSDPAQVVALLEEVARTNDGVLPEPAPAVLFTGFGDSSLDFQLRAWTARYEEWLGTRSALAIAVLTAFRDAGIQIPFPQRDVHLARDDGEGGAR